LTRGSLTRLKDGAMSIRVCAALLLLLSACATTEPSPREPVARDPKLANLQRAAALPWRDEGQCIVQEASQPWPVVVERCFHALDTRRVRFRDTERRCPVASADAATVETMVGICLLAQPELVVGAVVIIGVVVVAVAIQEELDTYAYKGVHPEEGEPVPETEPLPLEPLAKRRPEPQGASSGQDGPPPLPPEPPEPPGRRPECTPIRVGPKGGNRLHNKCADGIPFNAFRGANAFVNGKAFDALQPATRTLWEVKTNDIETYNPYVRRVEINKQIEEGRRERGLAAACGYEFVIGVRSEAHKEFLEREAPDFEGIIVVMDWC
jgi:Family of unknown function (DUF6310)